MMILTKSLRKISAIVFLLLSGGPVRALVLFDCVRDIMPLTEAASSKSKRSGVEKPFLVDGKYLVFPEVRERKLTGFFIYLRDQAWFYDSVEKIAPASGITALKALPLFENQVYKMVVQPDGLETLTLEYMPGFLVEGEKRSASEVLGASVLPVVGAFVSRPKPRLEVYNSPADAREDDLRTWVSERQTRRPANAAPVEVPRMMVRLINTTPKSKEALWAPLKAEHVLRKNWIQEHNLDQSSFRQLSALMTGACRE